LAIKQISVDGVITSDDNAINWIFYSLPAFISHFGSAKKSDVIDLSSESEMKTDLVDRQGCSRVGLLAGSCRDSLFVPSVPLKTQ